MRTPSCIPARFGGLGRGAFAIVCLSAVCTGAGTPASANSPPQVSSVRAVPFKDPDDGFRWKVTVRFNLADADGDEMSVRLYLYGDGGATYILPCTSTTSAPGAVFSSGNDWHVVWDAQQDYPGYDGNGLVIKVEADDGYIPPVPPGFVSIAPGTFMMGSPTDEPGRRSDETPHQVTLTRRFYIQSNEVTNQQYMEMAQWAYNRGYVTVSSGGLQNNIGSTPWLKMLGAGDQEIYFANGVFITTRPDHPVKYLTWFGAAAYCNWLSLKEELPPVYNNVTWQCNEGTPYTSAGYRLPTEAEWEYACRAGGTFAFANGPISAGGCSPLDGNLDVLGWYCGNAGGRTHTVAQKQPNVWGLYDLHGNVWEWCHDSYVHYGGTVTDPVGSLISDYAELRGGGWNDVSQDCRSARRYIGRRDYWNFNFGLRPVRSVN